MNMHTENKKKVRWVIILIMIAVASIAIRLLIQYDFNQSGLLYIGIPFAIALALTWIDRPEPEENWKRGYLNLTLVSLIIMLGSSVVLFEGFLCVVMFMPIYFIVIFISFIFKYFSERYKKRKGSQLFSHVLPLILLLSAFEGTHPELSLERKNQVNVTSIVEGNINEIKNKLNKPMQLQKDRAWFLELFPMPYRVDAGSLREGDIHEIHFRYHRWFVTNTHTGSMLLKIEKVSNRTVETRFIKDSSYIANYLKLNSTKIELTAIDGNRTQVTLTINYERILDPAWYFEPLQRYGITKTAEFLIAEVISPDEK